VKQLGFGLALPLIAESNTVLTLSVDYALIKKLAVRIPIDFRILADLFEAIDPNALAFPQYLTRNRTIHRHLRSLAEGSSHVGIVQESDTQRAALGVG
jgi:hypothetical protein